VLKSQINKLIDFSHEKPSQSKYLYHTNFQPKNGWSDEDPLLRHKCLSTCNDEQHTPSNISLRTTITTPANFEESITLYSHLSDEVLTNSLKPHKHDSSYDEPKSNDRPRSKYWKLVHDQSPNSKNSIPNEDSEMMMMVNREIPTMLEEAEECVAVGQLEPGEDKRKLMSRIQRLKNEISEEIKDLKMEIN
jgi:hypothetical protein